MYNVIDSSSSSNGGYSGRTPRKGSRLKDSPSSPRTSVGPVIPFNVPTEYLTYRSPLSQRYQYAVETMSFNFSDYKKYYTWRQLWTFLAKAQKVMN